MLKLNWIALLTPILSIQFSSKVKIVSEDPQYTTTYSVHQLEEMGFEVKSSLNLKRSLFLLN